MYTGNEALLWYVESQHQSSHSTKKGTSFKGGSYQGHALRAATLCLSRVGSIKQGVPENATQHAHHVRILEERSCLQLWTHEQQYVVDM